LRGPLWPASLTSFPCLFRSSYHPLSTVFFKQHYPLNAVMIWSLISLPFSAVKLFFHAHGENTYDLFFLLFVLLIHPGDVPSTRFAQVGPSRPFNPSPTLPHPRHQTAGSATRGRGESSEAISTLNQAPFLMGAKRGGLCISSKKNRPPLRGAEQRGLRFPPEDRTMEKSPLIHTAHRP